MLGFWNGVYEGILERRESSKEKGVYCWGELEKGKNKFVFGFCLEKQV